MYIDARWLALIIIAIFLVAVALRAPRWREPITIGMAAAVALFVLLRL